MAKIVGSGIIIIGIIFVFFGILTIIMPGYSFIATSQVKDSRSSEIEAAMRSKVIISAMRKKLAQLEIETKLQEERRVLAIKKIMERLDEGQRPIINIDNAKVFSVTGELVVEALEEFKEIEQVEPVKKLKDKRR